MPGLNTFTTTHRTLWKISLLFIINWQAHVIMLNNQLYHGQLQGAMGFSKKQVAQNRDILIDQLLP